MTAGANAAAEHEFEAAYGLPEPLPAGEHMLWQGAPDWRALAQRAFHVRTLALYFGVILLLHAVNQVGGGASAGEAALSALRLAALALLALGGLALVAWLSARTTVYSITDRRVVMRVGIVLTVTFNLPLRMLESAGLSAHRDGSGDIPLVLCGHDRIAYLHLWPHARPWRFARPEPMLRCVPEARRVAQVLGDAWAAANRMERRTISAAAELPPARSPQAAGPQPTPA